MGAIRTLLSFEEFERLQDEHEGKTELLGGELFHLPPPKRKHGHCVKRLYDALVSQIEDRKRRRPAWDAGEVYHEMGYLPRHKPGTWAVPDVSVTWPNQPGQDYYEGAPIVAIEIISESNYPAYVARKRALYLNAGAAEVWVVYPDSREAMLHTNPGERREDPAFHTELLPGIEIPFSEFLN